MRTFPDFTKAKEMAKGVKEELKKAGLTSNELVTAKTEPEERFRVVAIDADRPRYIDEHYGYTEPQEAMEKAFERANADDFVLMKHFYVEKTNTIYLIFEKYFREEAHHIMNEVEDMLDEIDP
jgi:hypothetical protein